MYYICVHIILMLCSYGQLPKECTLDKVTFDFECCPTTKLGVCGGPTRGSCEDIRIVDHCQNVSDILRGLKYCRTQEFLRSRPGTGNTDFRYMWPTQIFQKVCVCKGNYADYNCMRCKRGYIGINCSQPLLNPVVRRNILSFNDTEKNRFIEVIQMTKSFTSGYTVPVIEPVTTVSRDSFVEISLYDIFATFHYNTLRDGEVNNCHQSPIQDVCNEQTKCPIPDFAHEGPAFLTWHRGYMLYVETEIQKMLNDPRFALPYWDWTDENRRDQIWKLMGTSDCGIFSSAHNGMNNSMNRKAPVNTGPFMSWNTICRNTKEIICNANNQVCNPTKNPGSIYRCIGGTQDEQCRAEGTLPGRREVDEALKETYYDMEPYSIGDLQGGFRNALEGSKKLVERNENVCSHTDKDFKYTELHNRVHIYIGGTMLSVPMASNDPIFFLHHCNIDRLYEKWLGRNGTNFSSYHPSAFHYNITPGHNIDEYLVPMFPLITNRDIHRRAISFGYIYEEVAPQGSGSMGRSPMV